MKAVTDDCTPVPASIPPPDGRERTSPSSGPRRASEVPVAEPWRDALLRLSLELPIDLPLEELTRSFLERLMPVIPTLAIGACVVGEAGQQPVVLVRLPAGAPSHVDRDPTRLFPLFAEERIYELNDGAWGSTLHVACPNGVAQLSPFHLQVAERGALVLSAALARARAFHKARAQSHRVEELKAQLVQAEKLASLGQIVAGVVHELNNPLTSILAYAHHLNRRIEMGMGLDRDDAERLRRIGEAADRILKFSRDLVAYARPTSEEPGLVRLEDVVNKALVFCEHEFSAQGVRIERGSVADLPPLLAIAGQLTQVFVNLFTNAVHAMSERGGVLAIDAAVAPQDNALVVEISDTGCGISPEHLPQVFEPFFTTKPDGRGTGLGLSIVRDIVDSHGGTVGVRSVRSEGTTFRITLPLHGGPRT